MTSVQPACAEYGQPHAEPGRCQHLTHWNINAVESFAYQYDGDPTLYAPDPYRSSDHDPLILGIDLSERCCAGRQPTIVGTPGRDVLRGTNGSDVIMGLGGADVISGGTGNDIICGGAGADVLNGGNGNDQILGGFGPDDLYGCNGNDTLIGGSGSDTLEQERGRGVEIQSGPNS